MLTGLFAFSPDANSVMPSVKGAVRFSPVTLKRD